MDVDSSGGSTTSGEAVSVGITVGVNVVNGVTVAISVGETAGVAVTVPLVRYRLKTRIEATTIIRNKPATPPMIQGSQSISFLGYTMGL